MSKKIVIDTDKKKGQLFKVSESSGKFYVYDVDVGFISDNTTKIGEARSLQDAIEIIKASVDGTVRNIKIADW
jgi:hypothetical protein